MPRILFWNLKRKDRRNLVCQAARAESADVVILIENGATLANTLQDLKVHASPTFDCPRGSIGRFHVFCRDVGLGLDEVYGGDRLSVRTLAIASTQILLGVVHVVDRRNYDSMNQATQVQLLASDVRQVESRAGHDRTFLIGDFNMNPFDPAMNVAAGLNAMMTLADVEPGHRKFQGVKYPYFYNPMWGLFGDRTKGPAGTYFHATAGSGHFGWNILDQVLMRPSAFNWFKDVDILTAAGSTSLHTPSHRPSADIASDHFPLILTLK